MQLTQAELESLLYDKAYGMLTRPALEIMYNRRNATETHYIVLLDLDGIHKLNSQYASATSDGYAEVDALVRTAFTTLRETDLVAQSAHIGRHKSGDEITCLINTTDPDGFCIRLQASLQAQGLSATMAYIKVTPNGDYETLTQLAGIMVQRAKRARGGNNDRQ